VRLICSKVSLSSLAAALILYSLSELDPCAPPPRGGDLGGTAGDRPLQIIRWRGQRCLYPLRYLENVTNCHKKMEAAATACSCQAFQLLAEQVDTPTLTLSSLRVTLMIYLCQLFLLLPCFIGLSISQSINQSINQQISLPSDSMNRNHIKTDKICICTAIPMQFAKPQYTPPTPSRLNSTVALRRCRRCVGLLGIIDLSMCLCYHIQYML